MIDCRSFVVSMRLLFIGDIVGRAGRAVLVDSIAEIASAWDLDFVIVNGENAAGGFGITEAICAEFLAPARIA